MIKITEMLTVSQSGKPVKIGDTIYDVRKDEYYDVFGCDKRFGLLIVPNRISDQDNTTNYRTISLGKTLPQNRFTYQGVSRIPLNKIR